MPRLTVITAAGKRALAEVLAEHDPEYLDDLKMLAEAFGQMKEVGYEASDPGKQRLICDLVREKVLASK